MAFMNVERERLSIFMNGSLTGNLADPQRAVCSRMWATPWWSQVRGRGVSSYRAVSGGRAEVDREGVIVILAGHVQVPGVAAHREEGKLLGGQGRLYSSLHCVQICCLDRCKTLGVDVLYFVYCGPIESLF